MRDMLERLQTISDEQEDLEPEFHGPEYEIDTMSLSPQAVLFESPPAIESILKEAHSIRKEIALLQGEVEHLSFHNERFGTSVRRLSLLKRDSDSIARGIQQHGAALHNRLQALGEESSQLSKKGGPGSAVSRIAQVQYDALSRDFHAVMSDYNLAEETQRSISRERIQRQASIMGTAITDEQLDMLVDKGGAGLAELSQSLQTQGGRSCRWALTEIKGRHKELVDLEARLKEVHELFLDLAMLVEEQGSMVNNIEKNVCNSQEYVERVNVHIKKAIEYKRRNPFLQMCPCLSCWKSNQSL